MQVCKLMYIYIDTREGLDDGDALLLDGGGLLAQDHLRRLVEERLLWFRVWGLGFSIEGFGSRIEGGGFGVWGFGFWVLGFGFWVEGLGLRVQGLGLRVWS